MRIDNGRLRELGLNRFMPQWNMFVSEVKNRKLVVSEEIGSNWNDVLEILENRVDPEMIILDYIGCISTLGMKKVEGLDEYIKNMRSIAVKNNIACVLCSQINRSNVEGDREPSLTGLKGTGFLEEHSDQVWLLHYPAHSDPEANPNDFKIIVAKNKSGRTGAFTNVKFHPESYLFKEISTIERFVPVNNAPAEVQEVASIFGGKVFKES